MITVISDSHVPGRAPEIPEKLIERAAKSDRVVHCGDLVSREVYSKLNESFEKFIAVKGNCDMFDLPNSEKFSEEDIDFGIYHGTGIHPRGDHETLLDIARNKLEVDVLLHGHTHQAEMFREEGTVLLNPGSCTGVGGGSASRSNPSMMEIETGETIRARIIEIRDNRLEVKEEREFKIKE